jgi:sugar phosphate isomerase/epimerase
MTSRGRMPTEHPNASLSMYTRRDFAKTALASIPLVSAVGAPAKVGKFSSRFNGVQIGVQTYSYRSLRNSAESWSPEGVDRLMDRVVDAVVQDGINAVEFWIGLIEPPGGPGRTPPDPAARESIRKWRVGRPLEIFERCRKKYNDAGIDIFAAMFNFSDDCTDAEMESAFDMAKALGTSVVTANCTVRSIKRAAPFADKHNMLLSAHSENAPFDPNIDGMVFGDNLLAACKLSPGIRITLDIGHFTAYGGDVMKFVRENHALISNLHLKDRLKNHPEFHTDEDTPEWGKGNAPIEAVLQLMKSEKYPFPACIEYEYKSDRPAVEEVKRCLDYARAALA